MLSYLLLHAHTQFKMSYAGQEDIIVAIVVVPHSPAKSNRYREAERPYYVYWTHLLDVLVT